MRVTLYSVRLFERSFLRSANAQASPPHEFNELEARLTLSSAGLASGNDAVSIFVTDDASAPVLRALHSGGTRVIALRSAGFNHVDLAEADRLGMTVLRVPAYSPYAVAEHAVG